MSLFEEGVSAIGVLLGLTSYLLERALYRVGSLISSFYLIVILNLFFLLLNHSYFSVFFWSLEEVRQYPIFSILY